jgi:hypothetical protein
MMNLHYISKISLQFIETFITIIALQNRIIDENVAIEQE